MRGWRIFLVGMGLVVGLALACERSASQGMPPTPTFEPQAVILATPQGQMGALVQTPPGQPAPTSTPTPAPQQQPQATPTRPPTATAVPTQPAAEATPTPLNLQVPDRYVLKKGEFPYCIARRFNINPADLLQANGLPPGARPSAGTTLIIPKNARPWPSGVPRALIPHPTTYVVRAGDTLYSIACKFGDVWPEQIAQANGIPLSQMDQPLEPGKKLKIP